MSTAHFLGHVSERLDQIDTGGSLVSGGDRRPRDIDFNLVFPDEIRAKEFVQQFQRKSYRTTVRLTNVVKTHPWEVVVVKNMIPTHAGITGFKQELQSIADALGGYNDGLGLLFSTR